MLPAPPPAQSCYIYEIKNLRIYQSESENLLSPEVNIEHAISQACTSAAKVPWSANKVVSVFLVTYVVVDYLPPVHVRSYLLNNPLVHTPLAPNNHYLIVCCNGYLRSRSLSSLTSPCPCPICSCLESEESRSVEITTDAYV